jgi:hypothetical protein
VSEAPFTTVLGFIKLEAFHVTCNLFINTVSNFNYIALTHLLVECIMNWKICGKKRTWTNLMYHPGIFLKGQMKTTKTSVSIVHVLAKSETAHFPNTSQNCYHLSGIALFISVRTKEIYTWCSRSM